jgi:hypothetical protein
MTMPPTATTSASPFDSHAPAGPTTEGARTLSSANWLAGALALAAYVLLVVITRATFQGDTSMYANDVANRLLGVQSEFWEFGHALWRPLGYVLFRLVHPTVSGESNAVLYEQMVNILTWTSLVCGGVSVVAFLSWLRRLDVPRWPAFAATLAFAGASGFVGFAQTGTSYIPALTFLILGLREVAAEDRQSNTRTILVASLAFALAVLLWFPMVLAVPAAAFSMIALRGKSPERVRIAIAVSVISGLITIVVYAIIAYLAGVRSVADFRAWMAAASHGITGIDGVKRVVVGFARSLVNMDRLGLITKRHLVGDPFNPATWGDVLRAGLLRLALLYVVLGLMLVVLVRRPAGRRVLVFLVLTAIPVVGFAIKWQGGDLERYLAMYPALFLAVAVALASLPSSVRMICSSVIVLVLLVINVPAISRAKSDLECATLTSRISSVPRTDGRAAMLMIPHDLDEIVAYRGRCPSAAILKEANPPQIFGLVMANTERPWRDFVASHAKLAWDASGHVWVSRRAFMTKPLGEWRWAEGDDPKMRWHEFPDYFGQFDVGPPVGGPDGFVELLPTPKNRAALEQLRRTPR